jgi:hypothetical protein
MHKSGDAHAKLVVRIVTIHKGSSQEVRYVEQFTVCGSFDAWMPGLGVRDHEK